MTLNNLELMRTLDDSWNAQDWATFEKRHSSVPFSHGFHARLSVGPTILAKVAPF